MRRASVSFLWQITLQYIFAKVHIALASQISTDMDWPGADVVNGVPVILAQRPARNRPRHASEHHARHQVYYIQDGNGYLAPGIGGGIHRSSSAAGHRRGSANIIINNSQSQYDDYSPERRARPRSYHDEHYDSDSWDERAHSHERHRHGSRSEAHHPVSGTPSPAHDPELERRLEKLAILERKEEEEHQRQRFQEQQILDAARKAEEKKKQDELKKLAVEEYNAKKLEDELKAKKKKEDEDKAFRERVRLEFGRAGYSEESIDKILAKGEKGEKAQGHKTIMDVSRPTYIKVHRKHLSPETLDVYELPWEWDPQNSNYILIKRWIPEHDQDKLFDHTRRLREGRLLEHRPVDFKRERDQLMLVRKPGSRKKSPSRYYMFS